MRRPAGMTLIELLITLLLLAIMAALGVPTFTDLLLEMRMTTQVNRLVHAVHLAKHAAHVTLSQTVLCKSTDGRQCGGSPHWHDGWIVFVNRDADSRRASMRANGCSMSASPSRPGRSPAIALILFSGPSRRARRTAH